MPVGGAMHVRASRKPRAQIIAPPGIHISSAAPRLAPLRATTGPRTEPKAPAWLLPT